MTRYKFLATEKNSVTREKFVTDKISFDLQWAAAKNGVALTIYKPDVDRSGFDLIIDDGDLVRKIQIKSVVGKTSRWKIHKRLILPDRLSAEPLGFELSPEGVGLEGGVLLVKINPNDDTGNFSYLYTDIFILTLLDELCLVPKNLEKADFSRLKNCAVAKSAKKTISGLKDCLTIRDVTFTKQAFLNAKSPECLLSIIGLHGGIGNSQWRYNVTEAFRHGFRSSILDQNFKGKKNKLALSHIASGVRDLSVLIENRYVLPSLLTSIAPREF